MNTDPELKSGTPEDDSCLSASFRPQAPAPGADELCAEVDLSAAELSPQARATNLNDDFLASFSAGRWDEALVVGRNLYRHYETNFGENNIETLCAGGNYARALVKTGEIDAGITLLKNLRERASLLDYSNDAEREQTITTRAWLNSASAIALLENDQYEKAIAKAARAYSLLSLNPALARDNNLGWNTLEESLQCGYTCAVRLGQYSQADEILEELRTIYNNDGVRDGEIRLAKLCRSLELFGLAAELLEDSEQSNRMRIDPEISIKTSLERGNLLLETGRVNEAFGEFNNLIRRFDDTPPDDASVFLEGAIGFAKSASSPHHFAEARELMDEILEKAQKKGSVIHRDIELEAYATLAEVCSMLGEEMAARYYTRHLQNEQKRDAE